MKLEALPTRATAAPRAAGDLAAIGSFISLSANLQNEYPAMGRVGGQMALLWTEAQFPRQLFRVLIKEDGTFAMGINAVISDISPRAVVEAPSGGALLLGVIASGTPTVYQVVAQKLNSTLGLVGNPLPIAAPQNTDIRGIEVHSSPDSGQVLVTYRQAGVRYRILGTNFCAN